MSKPSFDPMRVDRRSSIFGLLRVALSLLGKRDKRKLGVLLVIQIFMAFLELVVLVSAGVVATLLVSGFAQKAPDMRVSTFLKFLGISELSIQNQTLLLSVLMVILLLTKTIVSIILNDKITRFFGYRGVMISAETFKKLYSQPIDRLQKYPEQELLYSLTSGFEKVTLGILTGFNLIVVDLSLILALSVGILLADPFALIVSVLFFGAIAFSLYLLSGSRIQKIGKKERHIIVESEQKFIDILRTYRENLLGNASENQIDSWKAKRLQAVDLGARRILISGMSRHVLELSVVLGGLLIAGVQFFLYDATKAAAVTGVFVMASARITPAIIRIQQEFIRIRHAIGGADSAINLLISEMSFAANETNTEQTYSRGEDTIVSDISVPAVSLRGVCYRFNENESDFFRDLSLDFKAGEKVAILGPSGRGKSTLVDVLLGIRLPYQGKVLLLGLNPTSLHTLKPNSIAYVPQNIATIQGSIRDNLLVGNLNSVSDQSIWRALRIAQLADWVHVQEGKLDAPIADKGTNLSGGQKQRLGLARAILAKPSVLVLDESTSALDVVTENSVVDQLRISESLSLIIFVAHRLSTIRNCDKFVYVDTKNVICSNTLEGLTHHKVSRNFVSKLLNSERSR